MPISPPNPAAKVVGRRIARSKAAGPTFQRLPCPGGLSLLELTAALAITSTLGAACMSLLTTVQASWLQHRQEMAICEQALAALAHIVRNGRQTAAVAEISPATLRLLVANGPDSVVERSWTYDAALKHIVYEDPDGSEVIAEGITSFSVQGLRHDLAIPADPSQVRAIACELGYGIPRPQGTQTESVAGMVWLRSW